MPAESKITAEHLKRCAYLYIRQSTLRQVLENTESTQRQYALRQRALALGWPEERIIVIDHDQAQSAATAVDREGFQRLVTEVGLGRAGLVMGLEVSRLTRNCADWHRLLAPEDVFAAVIEEIARLLPVNVAGIVRYDPDGMFTYVAAWGKAVDYVPPVGSQWMLGGHNLGTLVFETGRPARLDHYVDNSSGPASYVARKVGYDTAVGAPVIVEGHLWGLIGASSTLEQPLPPDTEARLASFTGAGGDGDRERRQPR